MIHNLKILGLALAAMCAFGAMSAAGASAQQGMLTSDGPVTLTGEQTGVYGSGVNAFTAFNGRTECENATYTGHEVLTFSQTESQEHGLLPSASTETTITPHYVDCTTQVPLFGHKPSTVDMNGCDYDFVLGETTGEAEDTYGVDAFVRCPKGKHIQVTMFNDESHENLFCAATIEHKETAYKGLHATDTTNGDIDITGTITGIKAKRSGPFPCSDNATTETAQLHIDVTVSGHNSGGQPTGIEISHTA